MVGAETYVAGASWVTCVDEALLPRFSTRVTPDLVLVPLAGVDAARFVVAMCRPNRAERPRSGSPSITTAVAGG